MNAPLCVRWLRAETYVEEVLSGAVAAGRLERLACQRHRRDLQAAEAGGRYVFDQVKAERVLRFIESLPHVKGEQAAAGATIRVEGWQAFCIGSLFGWVDRETDLRRFRTAYLEVARKNGKSTLLCGVGLYGLALDGEAGAEVYSAATTKEQARKVFDPARDMARRHGRLQAAGVRPLMHRIEGPAGSVFVPLASQTNSLDGSNPHVTVVDELHAHRSRDVWDVMGSGAGARRQPLMVAITTAGSELNGVCYEERSYVEKVLAGVFEDDSYFGVIYALDDGDDPFDPGNWRKANPNLGVSVSREYLEAEAAKAQRIPTRRGEFLRKHCCLWTAAGVGAFDFEGWRAGADPALSLDDFAACDEVVIGLDGSLTEDLTELTVAGWRDGELLTWTEHWATEDVVDREGNEHLRAWADAGLLTVCPGSRITLGLPTADEPDGEAGMIYARIRELIAETGATAVRYDPLYLQALAARLASDFGDQVLVIEQPQRTLALDPALRTAQALIRDRKVRHRGDPVMDWMLMNARAKAAGDFVKLFKASPAQKIDGVQAMLTALTHWGELREEAPAFSPWEDPDFRLRA